MAKYKLNPKCTNVTTRRGLVTDHDLELDAALWDDAVAEKLVSDGFLVRVEQPVESPVVTGSNEPKTNDDNEQKAEDSNEQKAEAEEADKPTVTEAESGTSEPAKQTTQAKQNTPKTDKKK